MIRYITFGFFAVLKIIGVALCWFLLFKLNAVIFSGWNLNAFVNWVFLPAFIRLAAVLVFDWLGVIGLFVGAELINYPDPSLTDGLMLSMCSAISPIISLWIVRWVKNIDVELETLTLNKLLWLTFIYAATNSIIHNLYFYVSHRQSTNLHYFGQMFMGDFVGTLITLYLISLVANKLTKQSSTRVKV